MKNIFIVGILVFSMCLYAEDKKEIIIVAKSWTDATNRDGTGLYWKILEKVYEPLGYTIIKKYRGYDEATQMIHSNNADIYLGAHTNEKDYAYYPKYYFDQDIVVAVYRNDSIDKGEGQKSLKGLKVGWIRGYEYDKFLNVFVQIKESNNRNNGLKQLENERLDAFLDDKDNIKSYLQKAKLPAEQFSQKIIFQLKVYPGFVQTPKGKA